MKIFMPFSALLAWVVTFVGAIKDIKPLTYLGCFGILILLVISLTEIYASKTIDKNKKLLWVIGLLPFNMIVMPVYFLLYRKKINSAG